MKVINSHISYGGGENHPGVIIVHAMGEYISDGTDIVHAVEFLNSYKLSAHILVAPNGDVYRCRNDNEIAWHARGHNTGSLGIEFLVMGSHNFESFVNRIKTPYTTPQQLESGAHIIKDWISTYDISRIEKHSTLSPDRKVDPGLGFPWDFLLNEVRG